MYGCPKKSKSSFIEFILQVTRTFKEHVLKDKSLDGEDFGNQLTDSFCSIDRCGEMMTPWS